MRSQQLDPQLFRYHREQFCAALPAHAMAIFYANDVMPRTADQHFPFRQQSDFFYLTGIDQPESVLILFPDVTEVKMREILFISQTTKSQKIWEGDKLTKDDAQQFSSISQINWLHEYPRVIHQLMREADVVYLNANESASAQEPIFSRDLREGKKLMARYPLHPYRRAQPILRKLRMIKNDQEISLIKKAIGITHQAFKNILIRTWSGEPEYKIEAVMIGTFINSGSTGHAFAPIVASGRSACILHYIENSRICAEGDLILLDFGAEYAHYAADVSRTIPASGKFNPRQREIYQAVLDIMHQIKPLFRAGNTLTQIHAETGKLVSEALLRLGLLTEEEAIQYDHSHAPYRRYFMHGVAHHLGLDVHDLSDRNVPLAPGMVLTCEPGIYILEEGIGIRLENDLLITNNHPIDLTEEIPIEIDEIERIIQGNMPK